MGILQEYKFYLIIAILALAGIALYFLEGQQSHYYHNYVKEMKSNYSRVKAINTGDQNLFNVFNVSQERLKGLDNGNLFGKNFNKSPIVLTDLFDETTGGFYKGDISESQFTISLGIPTDINLNGTSDNIDLENTINGDDLWNLENGGNIIFVFYDETIAKRLIDKYIFDGKIIPMTSLTDGTTKNVGLMIGF